MKKNTLAILIVLFNALFLNGQIRTQVNLSSGNLSVTSYTDKEVNLSGNANLHFTNSSNPLTNTVINLKSENAWVYFDNIRPQTVIDSYLQYISVNGNSAINKTNTRVSIYKQGTAVSAQASTFQPLKVYTGQNFTGDSASYSLFTFYNSLGTMENKIRSFKLKKGYMATVAINYDGTGYSRVYIADNNDLEISNLPVLLDQKISFIRAVNWEWVSKKGWAGSSFNEYKLTNSTWRYDWSAGGSTTSYVEYVPIRQNGGWPGWSEISGKQYVSHVLGFNEPDHTEQSNLTVSQALAQWPEMMKTGLRIGSPACTATSWLYAFMDSCKARNYRVDFVAWHAYWGGKSPQNWYNDLKAIYTRTGRPIWITEWNNGANWTTESWPTSDHSLSTANAAKQLADLKGILNVLDTASFIERYSIYNWVQDCRAMVLADTLTPAGKYYSTDNPTFAYNSKYEVIPTFSFKNPSLASSFTDTKITLMLSDPNFDYYNGYIFERKIDDGTFTSYASSDLTTLKTCLDTLDTSSWSKVRYRAKSKLSGGVLSAYTNEMGWDLTNGSDTIQCGNLTFNSTAWNPVIFKKGYSAIPVIITGAPSNTNSSVLVTPRIKLVHYKTRFNLQLAPWSYQSNPSFTKDENISYAVFESGKSFNFGGLKAQTGRFAVGTSWTKITFATPFDTIPVVFTNQLLSSTTFPTNLRVRNVTKTDFEVKIMKESSVKTAVSAESISYLAITPGVGSFNNKRVIVGRTADKAVGASYSTIYFNDSIANPIFIPQMQTCNDDSTATLRMVSLSPKFANVIKQKEKSASSIITTSFAEQVGWMVISPTDLPGTGTYNPKSYEKITIYPNFVKDIIHIKSGVSDQFNIEIYDIYGRILRKDKLNDNILNVENLKSGYYIIKINNQSLKFIKQ